MTAMQKRERMSKRYYKLIAEGKYEEADKLMKKIVNADVESLKNRLSK